MLRLWRIFWRSAIFEWRTLTTAPMERVLLIWLPALAIGLVWYTFSMAQVRDLPIGIQNQDNSALSRQLERFVDASPNVVVVEHYASAYETQQALTKERVYAVLVIPKDFVKRIKQRAVSPVILKVNAQYGTHSGIVQSGISSAVRTFSAGVELNLLKKMGMSDEQARQVIVPLKPDATMAFNLSLNYQLFLASNIAPALLHILAAVVGVGAIGRELRHKKLGHWFRGVCGADAQPSSFFATFFAMLFALSGKIFWQLFIFSLWTGGILLLMTTHRAVAPESLAITALGAWLMIVLSLWLGIILTALSMSKRMGLSLAGLVTSPAFAYSGVTFPVVAMPAGAQAVSAALPLTHYLSLQIAQMQAQAPWQSALPTIYLFSLVVLAMIVLGVALVLLSLRRKSAWGKR